MRLNDAYKTLAKDAHAAGAFASNEAAAGAARDCNDKSQESARAQGRGSPNNSCTV